MMTVTVGTAGYSYPAWAGGFYPKGLPAADQLGFYAQHFPAVEINSTFYRVPTVDQLLKMADRVPAGFRFTLKVPRAASHEFDPADLPAFARAASALADTGKLAGLLLQKPESFRNNAGNRSWLIRVRDLLQPHPLAIEFRHRSWADPAPEDWAARHGCTVASVGVPPLSQLFPPGLRVTAGVVYARLHSENPAGWYAGGEARYDYDYPEETLAAWASGLARAADKGGREAFVFFNNCVGIQAVTNARRLMAMLRAMPGLTVPGPAVLPGPPAPPAAPPRGLFDDEE